MSDDEIDYLTEANKDLEIINWYDEPVDWITEEYTGTNYKGYWKNWQKYYSHVDEGSKRLKRALSGRSVDYETLKWEIKELKDNVVIMRNIYDIASAKLKQEKSRKIFHTPAGKFYSYIASFIAGLLFIIGIISSAIELYDEDLAPTWLALFWFLLTSVITYISSIFATRWGSSERLARKYKRITNRRDIIESARTLIDVVDMDEDIYIRVAKSRATIEEKYGGEISPKYVRAIRKLDRQISQAFKKKQKRLFAGDEDDAALRHIMHNVRRVNMEILARKSERI